jgi:hypothetical protein
VVPDPGRAGRGQRFQAFTEADQRLPEGCSYPAGWWSRRSELAGESVLIRLSVELIDAGLGEVFQGCGVHLLRP